MSRLKASLINTCSSLLLQGDIVKVSAVVYIEQPQCTLVALCCRMRAQSTRCQSTCSVTCNDLREIARAGWEPEPITVAAVATTTTTAATAVTPSAGANPNAAPRDTPSAPSSATSSGSTSSRVWVERFGPADGFVYFTVRNEGRPDLASALTLNVNGSALGITQVSKLTCSR